MAQSIALAVVRDGNFIARAHRIEDQLARDHQLAMRVNQEAVVHDHEVDGLLDRDELLQKAANRFDLWKDTELLAKVADLYNGDIVTLEAMDDIESDASCGPEEDPQPESSAWAAMRNKNGGKSKTGHCVACGNTKDFFDVARVPCNHEYCRECLASLFRASMTDEALFPPRCDNRQILLENVRFFLPVELAKEFEAKAVELGSKNRIYCHDARCSAFIPRPCAKDEQVEYMPVWCAFLLRLLRALEDMLLPAMGRTKLVGPGKSDSAAQSGGCSESSPATLSADVSDQKPAENSTTLASC
ncbi:hypothetical protein B0A48_18551 [Cryoendolithus antarcticus]|uniref:RING-type domain-containing protein n=1 Tax=Cryoendolithus antarcticus TaxID=1507870 RepID=A0A1V8S8R5_9PEZI|nr:hypothetical protein B0A48_18551 [Cryoendolithus antarcticus]